MSVSPELEKRMAAAPYAQALGFRLLEVSEGYARVAVTLSDTHRNFMGGTDGGLIISLADYAFACSCNTYGDVRVAVQFSASILAAPEAGGELMAEGRTVRSGRRVAVTEISVTQNGKLVARATGTAVPSGARHG